MTSASAPLTDPSTGLATTFADPTFRVRRTRNWLILGLLYAFFYMTRYNYTAINASSPS